MSKIKFFITKKKLNFKTGISNLNYKSNFYEFIYFHIHMASS